MEFARMVIERNKNLYQKTSFGSEAYFLRQTGRTTNMVINALNQAKAGYEVLIKIHSHSNQKYINPLILHYADEMGLTTSQVDNISFVVTEMDLRGRKFDVIFVDNAVYDLAIAQNSGPRYQKGTI
jgi:hypothetical protein